MNLSVRSSVTGSRADPTSTQKPTSSAAGLRCKLCRLGSSLSTSVARQAGLAVARCAGPVETELLSAVHSAFCPSALYPRLEPSEHGTCTSKNMRSPRKPKHEGISQLTNEPLSGGN